VQEFSSAGAYITSFGSAGSSSGQFSSPKGVAVSSTGIVYAVDTGNNRIQDLL
jgi:DNA-binding beta-propeller fold protein YncE